MKHSNFDYICQGAAILLTAFLLNGCVIFSPIGNAISQGYENTVSYFNVYYNAKRLFADTEDEIREAAKIARAKETSEISANQENQIPSSAKQKLGQVIDKCSNILAFHPTSSLVDDALLIIGKSFYYQSEYLKAERKFVELLAQYPNSPLNLEAQLWYARTEEKLDKLNEGIRLAEAIVSTAKATDEKDIEVLAHQLLGSLYRKIKADDKAVVEYEKTIALSTDEEIRSNAQIILGDIFFSNRQYGKSAEMYLRTEKYTSDIYLNYYSKLQACIAYREMGENKKELVLLNAMIKDFRNKEYLPALYYERANNYVANERQNDAISEYIYVDTTYKNTEYRTKSAYQLGRLYEKYEGNYKLALKYYAEVDSTRKLDIATEGRSKYRALTRYFNAWGKLTIADSLFLVVTDTTHKINTDTLDIIANDTTKKKKSAIVNPSVISRADSVKSIIDTARSAAKKTAAQPALLNVDSIKILKSIAAQELGDVFYSEIVVPDSAFYWYNKSLDWNYGRIRSPRILYILAELSRTNPSNKFPAPEEYYNRLDRDFSESVYAEEARRHIGKESLMKKSDPAVAYYEQAEKQIDSKQYKNAIVTLRNITYSYPKSPFAAKSEYAIGWLMDNCLAQPDSAILQYKRVVKEYAGTKYALAAMKRSVDSVQTASVVKDTIKVVNDSINLKPVDLKDVKKDSLNLQEKAGVKKLGIPKDEIDIERKRRPSQNQINQD